MTPHSPPPCASRLPRVPKNPPHKSRLLPEVEVVLLKAQLPFSPCSSKQKKTELKEFGKANSSQVVNIKPIPNGQTWEVGICDSGLCESGCKFALFPPTVVYTTSRHPFGPSQEQGSLTSSVVVGFCSEQFKVKVLSPFTPY